MQKVAKASGANYSFHKEASSRFQDSAPQGPVVCSHSKHEATSNELNSALFADILSLHKIGNKKIELLNLVSLYIRCVVKTRNERSI